MSTEKEKMIEVPITELAKTSNSYARKYLSDYKAFITLFHLDNDTYKVTITRRMPNGGFTTKLNVKLSEINDMVQILRWLSNIVEKYNLPISDNKEPEW
jgi:hypothetical protein